MEKRGKHIVMLTPGFAAGEKDSNCIPVLQRFVEQYRCMHPDDRVTIIAFQYPFQPMEYDWRGIRVISMGGANSGFPMRIGTWLKVFRRFRMLHDNYPVDVIQSFWLTECAFIGSLLARRYHLPHVATMMGQDNKPSNRYLKLISKRNTRIVGLSDFSNENLYKNFGLKSEHIIPFGEVRKPSSLPDPGQRTIDVLGVGSVVPVKNYCLFAEVIAGLKKDFPSIHSVILGDLSHEAEVSKLKARIRELNLEENITLAGNVPSNQVEAYMNASRLLLHTSIYEAQSTVWTEALYCGLHIVCHDTGNIYPEKMHPCHGKEEMIYHVRRLLQDRKLTFEPFIPVTMEETVNAYHRLYQ